MESSDDVTVEISPDGGSHYYSTAIITGNGSSRWNFSATGNATTAYDGDANAVTFTQVSGLSTTSASTVNITGLPVTSNLKVRITLSNSYKNELWVIDEFSITGDSEVLSEVPVIGYDNKSVTSTSDTVKGLIADSTYYFKVRAVNATLTSINSNVVSVTTYPTPLTEAIILTSGTIGSDIVLNWANGNGVARLVRINSKNKFKKPKDRVDYSGDINTTWQGSGEQNVYDGTGSTITISGMDTVATYYVAIYEYLTFNEAKAAIKIYSHGASQQQTNTGTLPISLLSFTAERISDAVSIKWTTTTEENNDFFTIEKSTNGVDFYNIAEVLGAGNSNRLTNYEIIDNSPLQQINYYRLRQTDFDGKSTVSEVIILKEEITNFELINSWSSSNNTLQLEIQSEISSNANCQILNIQGQIVYNSNIEILGGHNNYSINLPSVAKGTYIVKVENNGIMAIRKIIL